MRKGLLAAAFVAVLGGPALALPPPAGLSASDAPVALVRRSLPYPYTSPVARARPNAELRAFRRCMRDSYGPRYYHRVSAQRKYLLARVCGI
jgi:hypothetical protein